MSYRDELRAAEARIVALEIELESARARVAELEAAPLAAPPAERAIEVARPRRIGKIHFHPPRSYLPLFHLFRAALVAARSRAPSAEPLTSDNVLLWVLYNGLWLPITYAIRLPLYVLAMCIVLPWTAMIVLALSVLLLPIVLASRFSFSASPPGDDTGWFHGEASESQGAMFLWVIMSFTLAPLLVVTTSLLADE